jgi:hypothetical protein
MKKIILVLILQVAAVFATVAQNVVSSEEQASIKKVITEESKAFYARDFEKWERYYRVVPQTYLAFVDKGKMYQFETWDKIKTSMEAYFDKNPNPTKPTDVKREHYSFRKVNPTYVWLTFDQVKTIASKKESTKELRILEMIKGEWKIVNRTGFLMQSSEGKSSEEVQKDKKIKHEPTEELLAEPKNGSAKKEEKTKKSSK